LPRSRRDCRSGRQRRRRWPCCRVGTGCAGDDDTKGRESSSPRHDGPFDITATEPPRTRYTSWIGTYGRSFTGGEDDGSSGCQSPREIRSETSLSRWSASVSVSVTARHRVPPGQGDGQGRTLTCHLSPRRIDAATTNTSRTRQSRSGAGGMTLYASTMNSLPPGCRATSKAPTPSMIPQPRRRDSIRYCRFCAPSQGRLGPACSVDRRRSASAVRPEPTPWRGAPRLCPSSR
jgi:hypothetical protein